MAAATPLVRVLGPGRNIGKTWLASHLIEELVARGYRVGAIKSSHHLVPPDREGSDTALFGLAGAQPVVFAAGDGTLTRAEPSRDLGRLVAELPPTLDVVVVEGFKADPLGARIEIVPGTPESAVRLWTMDGVLAYEGGMSDLDRLSDALCCALGISASGDELVRADIRRAARVHGHRCPGLTLGVRMARYAARYLEVSPEPSPSGLVVEVETARCATDAIAAVTGCTTGNRRLLVNEYGKLAATFSFEGRAVRIAARAGLRELALLDAACEHSAHAQDQAYRTFADETLFDAAPAEPLPTPDHHRGGRGLCERCGEEVAAPALERTASGSFCRPCAVATGANSPRLTAVH
ncbi:MAG: molybdopterin-guanine dinucleotide biosynthesis protein MobB [Dehalococcoidia bacterium]|nr:molybdopterin-guanine dinucleotide biosynthesis protein MobB [Dehalococcoidia bacterium]